MTFTAMRPQSARPSAKDTRTGPKTNKITLGTYRFRAGTSSLERIGSVDVHSNALIVLSLLADDTSPLYQPAFQLKMQLFRAHLPSMVIVGRHSEPLAWYHTNKEGYLVKKHATHCTWKHVRDSFCGRYHPNEDHRNVSSGTANMQWPVAIAKFPDGRMRLLTLHSLYALLRSLDAQCPSETQSSAPFCIQAFVPPAKRVRYISIYTMVRNVSDCQVVVAELPTNYREQTHDENDVNIADEPIEILESENSPLVESIKRTTLLLIHHVNRKHTSSDSPVISKFIAEYMIHTKDNECYLTSILGVSWQNGDQVQLADYQTQKVQDASVALITANNQFESIPKTQRAIARQIKNFSRSLKGSTELYEAAERHATVCQEAAEKYHARVVELEEELEEVKSKLDSSTAYADAQRKIKILDGKIELRDKEIANLEAALEQEKAKVVQFQIDLEKEREVFCSALRDSQMKIQNLSEDIQQRGNNDTELENKVRTQELALHSAKLTSEALQIALDKQKLDTHVAEHDMAAVQKQLDAVEAENEKLRALLPFATVKKVNHSEKMHLHDMAMEWPSYRMEIGLINRALSAHYSVLKRLFTKYLKVKIPIVVDTISLGRTHPLLAHQLNAPQVLECMEECHIITTRFTSSQVEALFLKCTSVRWQSAHGTKITTAGVSIPRGMVFHEFMERIVRIAYMRGGGRTGLVAESLHLLIEECIYPVMRKT